MIPRRTSAGFTHGWIVDAFRKRGLPAPTLRQIEGWTVRSLTDAALLETVYSQLKRASVERALSLLGLDPGRLPEEQHQALVGQVAGGCVDLPEGEMIERLKMALSDLLFAEVGGEFDPVVRLTLLTRDPWRLYALALSDLPPEKLDSPSNMDRQIALGVERMMEAHGRPLPRKDLLKDFREARAFLREERARVRQEAEKERRKEQHFHAWVRSLWSDRDVRRELGLRPSEFEEWVEGGRIPVVLRIESFRNGRIRERRLFDPD
ncbi:MAG: hypothetical protein D084_Lepto4C00617G0001, partial [Leptospirillum sp. Group IV 'UBA BS']